MRNKFIALKYKNLGRPKKKINLDHLQLLRLSGLGYRKISKILKVSPNTVIKNCKLINQSSLSDGGLK